MTSSRDGNRDSFSNNHTKALDMTVDITMENEEQEEELPLESRISKILSEQTTKVVVLLVLALLFILPSLQLEVYTETYLIHDNGLHMIVDSYNSGTSWDLYKQTVAFYAE